MFESLLNTSLESTFPWYLWINVSCIAEEDSVNPHTFLIYLRNTLSVTPSKLTDCISLEEQESYPEIEGVKASYTWSVSAQQTCTVHLLCVCPHVGNRESKINET